MPESSKVPKGSDAASPAASTDAIAPDATDNSQTNAQPSSAQPVSFRQPFGARPGLVSFNSQQSPSTSRSVSRRLPSATSDPHLISTTATPVAVGTVRSRKGSKQGKNNRVLLYSTDDDREELEADFGKDYMEGFSRGLKEGRRKALDAQAKRSPLMKPTPSKDLPTLKNQSSKLINSEHGDNTERHAAVSSPRLHSRESVASIVHDLVDREDHHDERGVKDAQDRLVEEFGEEDEFGDMPEEHSENEEDDDSASISTNETFTLRERQDAINITHPFGIRIWKPALYKKDRSVQRIAEGDIHSRPGKDISWTVWVGNVLWTLTFGLVLFFASVVSAGVCFLLFWSESSIAYGQTFLDLGRYLLFPFGVCVQLWQDERYFGEDGGDGHTVAEYETWQNTDHARQRLFFGPSTEPVNPIPEEPSMPADEDTADNNAHRTEEQSPSSSVNGNEFKRKRRFFGRGEWTIGRILFYILFYTIMFPLLFVIALICWLGVFSLPMARVTTTLSNHLRRHPLALSFVPANKLKNLSSTEYNSSILLCTYRAMGSRYYKYTVDGTNIFFINLMFPVLFVIFDYYVLAETLHWDYFFTNNLFIFFLSLAAVIPLAYFIGQAVASISAQTSMGMGATINAFFSTIVEVFLYTVALNQGKGDLVEGSIVGSIFAGVLLLPGLSMCAGAIKRKTQRYNPNSAGVSSTMLLFAVIGAFAPTIFYQIYGPYELRCVSDGKSKYTDYSTCHFKQAPLTPGPFYTDIIQPFSYMCSALLFISYVIGLWFTLRTHAALIWSSPTGSQHAAAAATPSNLQISHAPHVSTPLPLHNPPNHTTSQLEASERPKIASKKSSKRSVTLKNVEPVPLDLPVPMDGSTAAAAAAVGADAGGGHDAPNWSRTKSTIILLGATILYAVIAEVLVDTVDVVLEGTNISQKFLGITIFALVPNTTEFLNAISFAMHGNVSLSMEIGSAYALQVCLLQIPALVLYSIYTGPLDSNIQDYMFTLIFPRWDLFMVIFCVFVFSYIYAEGKSNYFKGSILVLSYLVVMLGFYFSGNKSEDGVVSGSYAYYAALLNSNSATVPQFVQQGP